MELGKRPRVRKERLIRNILPFTRRRSVVDPAASGKSPSDEERSDASDEGDVGGQLTALLAGDVDAAAWLYDTFSRNLFRRLHGRYGGHPGVDVEDLLHDAFVMFYRGNGKILRDYLSRTEAGGRTVASLERRLWDVTCGLVANRKRSVKGRQLLPLSSVDRPSAEPTPERDFLGRDELDRLDACLRRRGQRIYLYFCLRFEDGLAPREIVTATGWSRKATYKLRQALDEAIRACCESLELALSLPEQAG